MRRKNGCDGTPRLNWQITLGDRQPPSPLSPCHTRALCSCQDVFPIAVRSPVLIPRGDCECLTQGKSTGQSYYHHGPGSKSNSKSTSIDRRDVVDLACDELLCLTPTDYFSDLPSIARRETGNLAGTSAIHGSERIICIATSVSICEAPERSQFGGVRDLGYTRSKIGLVPFFVLESC